MVVRDQPRAATSPSLSSGSWHGSSLRSLTLMRKASRQTDWTPIHRWVAALIGEPVVSAVFTYGGELEIHLGERQPYEHPRLKNDFRGEWLVATRASEWLAIDGHAILARAGDDESEAGEQLAELTNRHVTDASFREADLSLFLGLQGGYSLAILGRPVKRRRPDAIACWELRSPDHRELEVGPTRSWSLRSFDGDEHLMPDRMQPPRYHSKASDVAVGDAYERAEERLRVLAIWTEHIQRLQTAAQLVDETNDLIGLVLALDDHPTIQVIDWLEKRVDEIRAAADAVRVGLAESERSTAKLVPGADLLSLPAAGPLLRQADDSVRILSAEVERLRGLCDRQTVGA
jgi:hypothetical protein